MEFTLTSSAFSNGAAIPRKYTGDGEDISPPLAWSGVPEGTQQFALLMDDPDAPTQEPWVHWLLYHIPATTTMLPEGVVPHQRVNEPRGALQGQNSWPATGYRGPAPPPGHGVHHYHFRLYALDKELDLAPGLDANKLVEEIDEHTIDTAELVGTYQR